MASYGKPKRWMSGDARLISGRGAHQLALGVRLASRYPIVIDDSEGPGV